MYKGYKKEVKGVCLKGGVVRRAALLVFLALLALAATSCMPALQEFIGLDQGGDGQVTALDSEGSDSSEDGGEAELVPLVGKGRKEVIKELKTDEDFPKLKAILASQGLKMKLGKAEAYEITSTEESEAAAQALGMEGDDNEEAGTLVAIPFGNSGHLLQVGNGEADHTWAEIAGEDGRLTYIDTEVEAHFLFPDEGTRQELLAELEDDPDYQAFLGELAARGEAIAGVKVVIDEEAQEAHLLVETGAEGEMEAQAVVGIRKPRIDELYALDFAVRAFGKPNPEPEPVEPGQPRLIAGPVRTREPRELLPEPRERVKLAAMFGAGNDKRARLERGVFFHEFIQRTQLEVEEAKLWLGDEPAKKAFGRPADPFSYKLRLKRAPWLSTELQLELLDGCDSGNWVPKGKQLLQPGQREVAWEQVKMTEYWDKNYGGKVCKFRVRDLQNGRALGPYDGPKLKRLIAREDLYETAAAASSAFQIPAIYIKEANLLLYGFKDLSAESIQVYTEIVQEEKGLLETILGLLLPYFEALKKADASEILAAIEWLAQFVVSPEPFIARIEEAQQLYPSFDTLWLMLMDLYGPNKAKELIFSMAWLVQNRSDIWVNFKQLALAIQEALTQLGLTHQEIPIDILIRLVAFINTLGDKAENMFEVVQATHLLLDTIYQILGQSHNIDEKKALLLGLLNLLPGWFWPCIFQPGADKFPCCSSKGAEEFIAKVEVINRMMDLGWHPIAIGFNTEKVVVDFIATREINFRRMTTFVKVYNEYDRGKIANEVTKIAEFVSKHEDDPKYPGQDYITVVINQPTSASEIERLKKRYNNHGMPVVIIYKGEDGKWHVTCTCTADFSEFDAQEAAEAMGYDVNDPSDADNPSLIFVDDPAECPPGMICAMGIEER